MLTAESGNNRRVQLGDLPQVIGGTEPDGTPTVLTRLPEPSEEDRYGREYWWNADDDADHDSDFDNDQPAGLSSTPPRPFALIGAPTRELTTDRRCLLRRHRQTPQSAEYGSETQVVLFPPKPRAPRDARWRVGRIDTEPIKPDDYTRAVATLAILINQWRLKRETMKQARKTAA